MESRTKLDPEEYAYPAGSLRQSRRKCRAMFPDGVIRTVTVGIPDTYFSIPAFGRVAGKYVAGYVGCADWRDEARESTYTAGGCFPSIREGEYYFVPRSESWKIAAESTAARAAARI